MVTKSKIVVIATIAALSYAGPVFAQSFNRADGTGNELSSYYDSDGGLHAGIAPQNTPGLYAFAPPCRPHFPTQSLSARR